MKSFQEHLNSTGKKNPELSFKNNVLRSSAIFPFIINESLDAKILFLSYWLLKRKIQDINYKITIRNLLGKSVFENKHKISYTKSFVISVKEIVKKNKIDLNSGSIEVEFFSKTNLVFPFPAVIFNFDSKKSSTLVHSCGRIFNNKYDLKNNTKFLVAESGFDILPDNKLKPFFSFVNGKKKLTNQKFELIILNQYNEKIKRNIKIKEIKPYETKFLFFLSQKDKFFLKNKKGTVRIKHSIKNFFPRFMCGNFHIGNNFSTLTHSYYDLSNNSDKLTNLWKNPNPQKYYDGIVSIPVFFAEKKYTELAIYPNFFRKKFSVRFEFFNKEKRFKLKKKIIIDKKFNSPIYLNISDMVLREVKNINKNKMYVLKVICEGNKIIPARIKFGLNIGQKKDNNISSNVCFNVHVSINNFEKKPRSFRWGPILPDKNYEIFLSNTSFLKNNFKKANILMKFWNTKKNNYISKKISIIDNGFYKFSLKKNNNIYKFLNKKPGWFTVESDNPFITGFFINFGNNGIVGSDHLF